MLGYARDGAAVLLVSDESGRDRQFSATEWLQSLDAAADEAKARVLVLLDPGPAITSWDRGILGRDFTSQLRQELESKKLSNLCVIVAAGPGETSWRITDVSASAPEAKEAESKKTVSVGPQVDDLGRSVFSHYVVSGLRGERTDTSGRAIGTADDGPKGNRDSRISADELYAYVAQNVSQWVRTHRGVEQTVMQFGGPGNFTIGAVTAWPKERSTHVEVIEGSAVKPVPASSKDEKSKAGKKEQTAAADAPSSEPGVSPSLVADHRLTELWKRRDELAESVPPADEVTTDDWRALQERLLAAEQRVRFGLIDAADRLLDESETLIAKIATKVEGAELTKRFGGSWHRPFLSTLPVATAVAPAKPNAAEPKRSAAEPAAPPPPELSAQLEEASKAPAGMPIPNEQALRDRLVNRDARSVALDWIVASAEQATSHDRVTAIARVAALIPAAENSPELRAIQRFAEASVNWNGVDAASQVAQAARCIALLGRFGRVGLSDPQSLSASRQSLAEGLLALAAAQRWLILAGDAEEADRHLRRAETALRRVEVTTTAISTARRFQARLRDQLPELTSWAAEVRERERQTTADDGQYDRLRQLATELQSIEHDAAITPDANWGLIRSRIDAAWASADIDDASGTGADLSALIAGEQRLARLLRQFDIRMSETNADETLTAKLREISAALEGVPRGIANAIAEGGQSASWLGIESQLNRVRLPELTADRRDRLRQELAGMALASSSSALSEDSPRWRPGTWQGFWARQVLRPFVEVTDSASSHASSERMAQVDTAWNAFLDGAKDGEATKSLSLRSELGNRVRILAEVSRRSHSPNDSITARTESVAFLLELFADADALVGAKTDLREAWASLSIADRPSASADGSLLLRPIGGELAASNSVVAADGSREATLPLRSFPKRGQLYVKSSDATNPVDLFLAGQPVRGGELPLEAVDPQPTIRFRSNLIGREVVIVALVDRDGFPISIHRVDVVPEVSQDRWRIRFGSGPDGAVVLTDAVGVLSLPPATVEPLTVLPLLEFPAAAATQTATIEVQRRESPDSSEWTTVLGPKTFSLRDDAAGRIDGDLRRIPLDFAPESAAPAATSLGGNAPATPSAAAATSFTFHNGLRFLVRIDGDDLPPREIWPVTFEANRFIVDDANMPNMSLVSRPGEPPRIEAVLTASSSTDPRLPKTLPIELEFDRRLADVVGQQRATRGFIAPGTGNTLNLFGQIAPDKVEAFESLLVSPGGGVSLSVGGLPRAYRWRLRGGRQPDRVQPADTPLEIELVRVAAPAAAPMGAAVAPAGAEPQPIMPDPSLDAVIIERSELEAVSLRFHIHQLDAGFGGDVERRPWTLIGRLSEPRNRQGAQEVSNDAVVRRFDTQMTASVTGSRWSLAVASKSYEAPLKFRAAGRFELTAVLRAPGNADADAASKPLRLVIDDSAPEAPRFSSPPANAPVPADRDMKIVCVSSDPESGVRSIELRVDSNGNGAFEPEMDSVKRFDEADLSRGTGVEPWTRSGEENVEWVVPANLLPPAPASGVLDRVTIWAVAENRQGKTTEAKALRLDLKRPKPKLPPPPTTGDIVVTVTPKPRPLVEPEIVLVGPDGSTDKRSGKNATFSKLKPGKYEIRVTQGSTQFKGQGEASVTVEAGKSVPVNIKVQ
ncbi:MAG: FUSC family protein [Planctomycetota bacterium]|nr:FUSC family protein [Planctomycetota bacterium]